MVAVDIPHKLWQALSFAFGMTWEILWALILGFLLSAVVQALVLAEPTDLTEYATRLEERASALPPHLAREALADAAWARQERAVA